MTPPQVRYTRCGGSSVAFQTAGEGPDILIVAGAGSTSATWDDPNGAAFFSELARTYRLTTFDQRGAGRSDPLTNDEPLPLEDRVAEAMAVLDAIGAPEAHCVAMHDGGPVALLAVTAHPERFRSLSLLNSAPRMAWAADYPQGFGRDVEEWFVAQLAERWGTGFTMSLWAPSYAQLPRGVEQWARTEVAACPPGQAVRQTRQSFATDARDLLELVAVPTLVFQRRGDRAIPEGNGRYLADRIVNATLVEVPGDDHMPYAGDTKPVLSALRSFLGAGTEPAATDRRLGAVVFTDIVGSTEQLNRLGDARWAELLDVHDRIARERASELGGRVVKSTGDGVLALFSGPAHAIRFAVELQRSLAPSGLELRGGVHAGEVMPRGDDIAGVAVHAAARVAALAPAGAVYVSRTVTDLVAGSGFVFEPAGEHDLKGLPGCWDLYRVSGGEPHPR